MELANYLSSAHVVTFFLLFIRFAAMFTFLPFFNSNAIPMTLKGALIMYITIFFYPNVELIGYDVGAMAMIMMAISEITLGFLVGLVLNIVFGIMMLAGQQIAMIMGFTMANVMDPQTQTQTPIISLLFSLLTVMLFLAWDFHHGILLFLDHSIDKLSLGLFYPSHLLVEAIFDNAMKLFVIGFVVAFPITALSLLSDVIFGMLMKTMPQFNLLVVGFPIKIFLAFAVMVVVLGSMMKVFKNELLIAFEFLKSFLM
jgi:flagellar biosynthetic protein FliR